MNAATALELPLGLPPWRLRLVDRDERDWLSVYLAAEAEAELAAELVRAACEAYRHDRNAANTATYRAADRAYDAARARFQTASFEIVGGIRAIAGIARAIELASASRERML